jgi:hypothetical protein
VVFVPGSLMDGRKWGRCGREGVLFDKIRAWVVLRLIYVRVLLGFDY